MYCLIFLAFSRGIPIGPCTTTPITAFSPYGPGVTPSPQLLLRGYRHLGPMGCTMVSPRFPVIAYYLAPEHKKNGPSGHALTPGSVCSFCYCRSCQKRFTARPGVATNYLLPQRSGSHQKTSAAGHPRAISVSPPLYAPCITPGTLGVTRGTLWQPWYPALYP